MPGCLRRDSTLASRISVSEKAQMQGGQASRRA